MALKQPCREWRQKRSGTRLYVGWLCCSLLERCLGQGVGAHDRGSALDGPRGEQLPWVVPGRRLFSFSDAGVSSMCHTGVEWVRNTSASLGLISSMSGSMDLSSVTIIFERSTTWVTRGYEVAQKAWDSMR